MAAPAAHEELLRFLRPEARLELRARAVQGALGLSGSADGRRLLLAGRAELARALLALTGDPAAAVSAPAALALLNLAAADPSPCAEALRDGLPGLLCRLHAPADPCADTLCALLGNLSREEAPCAELFAALQQQQQQPRGDEAAGELAPLVDALCARGAALPHLGPLLCNLSQLPEARAGLLDRSRRVRGGGARARAGRGGRVGRPRRRCSAPRKAPEASLPPAGAWCRGCCRSRSTRAPLSSAGVWWARSETAASTTVSGDCLRASPAPLAGGLGVSLLCFPPLVSQARGLLAAHK